MNKRVSSTVTKRKANPRPRKYASASERQAAYRARAPEVCFRAEPKTVETLDRIADTIDRSRAELLLSMTKFALTNHDWARFGLTHKPLPFEYGVNPVKLSPHQRKVAEVNRIAREHGLAVFKTGNRVSVETTDRPGLPMVFDDYDQALKHLRNLYGTRKTNPLIMGDDIQRIGIFNVRYVREGEQLGPRNKSGKTIGPAAEPVVEFYDSRYPHTKRGQFVSSYYARTLNEAPWGEGLILDTGSPDWQIDRDQLLEVKRMIATSGDFGPVIKRKTNPMKTTRAKRKPTPAQLAARERFAEMARSGAFKKAGAAKRKKNPDNMGSYGPFYGDTDAPMTEAQIERKAESYMDRLDRQLMRNEITQTVYDREVKALDKWTKDQYAKRRKSNPTRKAAGVRRNPIVKDAVSKLPSNFKYGVQTKATENWSLQAAFKTKVEAMDYAQAIAKNYPRLPIRVVTYTGGPIPA